MRSRHHSFKEVSKPSTQTRRRFSVCFGKKLLENNRRISQPNLLEHGGNINHSDAQQLIGHQQRVCTMNVSSEQEEVTGNGRCFHFTLDSADMSPHHLHVVGPSFLHPTDFHPLLHRGDVLLKSNRSSHSSDSSSAYYSGSDIIHSVPSSLDDPEVDLSGLAESAVDSDEEEELAESLDSLTVRDTVKECLDKSPCMRTDEDIEFLLEFVKHLPAFANMTLAVRRALCAVMAFVRFEKMGSVVLNDGEELDSWSVIINGQVEIENPDGTLQELHLGASFGISPSMDKIFHHGIMRTKVDDCQFICVGLTDYYNILHQGEENTKKHEEDGRVVLITEHRIFDGGNCKGHVVIRGTVDRLISQLVEDNSMDPCYIEDFLLTYRIFSSSPLPIANNLIEWFNDPHLRDKVTRVVLLWVNNHFTDFETDRGMMDFLEKFEACLESEKMKSQLQLLNLASATKARSRTITLARSTRDEVLHFSILGGYERGFGIFVSKVNRNSKAEEMGLKRGDQILEVNGQSFEHMSHAKALEILRGTTHLCITVRSNLLTFKEMLNTPENSPRPRGRKTSEIARLQPDPRARLSSQMEWQEGNNRNENMSPKSTTNFIYPSTDGSISKTNGTPSSDGRKEDKKGFMTLGHKAKLRRALAKISLIPKSLNSESHLNSSDDSLYAGHHNGGSGYRVRATSPQRTSGGSMLFHSHSNPDLTLLFTSCDQDLHLEYPEHVLKIYRPDQTCKYLLVHKETTAREVVMLSLREFSITDPSSNYSLCEVSVGEGGMVKQRRLPDQLQNLAERINLSSRYYLKNNASTEPLVPDELAVELLRDNQVHLLHLNSVELATQLTLEDFSIFRQVEPTEYVDDLFEVKSKYGTPMLSKFMESVNKEMFWVVSEICSEPNLIRRMKKIKQFIKVARQCRECKNFNSMFAILSGLGHGAVSRLRATWEKLPSKYQKIFEDLQDLMDPSRNMFKYRALLCSENIQPPMIPFYPLVKKDLTFIHLGNDTTVDGLINFEKLRMIAKEVRQLMNMCSAPYDLFNMLELGGAAPTAAMASLNSFATTTNAATVKRRKKSSTQLNPKKMFEEAQMVRRVKAYLANLKITTNEDQLHAMSLECEPMATTGMSAVQTRRRHPSPTLSSASSNSTTSEGKKSITSSSRFGADSPQAVRKLLSLSESSKVRPHQSSHPHHSLTPSPFPSPNTIRRRHDSRHGRSHSDTTNPMLPVELSSESSSVVSFNNFHLRKSQTSGRSQPELGPVWSMNSSDSGSIGSYPTQPSCDTDSGHVSSNFDTHSNSSMGSTNSPPQQRSQMVPRSPPLMRMRPSSRSFSHGVHVLPPIPGHSGNRMVGHNVHAKMSHNRKIAHLGRAHSQDRMLVGYYSSDVTDPEDDGEV
ncbi:rap guanine nucleotide exchange factor 2-like isoform X2 [Centruroides vittatus]|uniref:rap guanine nucleotide exchange factor 2-like isoform X2 n=1 Tax=Centruroides vittatus TaxID=120091 RepID=UPI00350EE94B